MSKPICISVILLSLMLFVSPVSSQENTIAIIDEINNVDEVVQKNEFDNLISSDKVVYQLRKNYGIKGSVILTQSLWQILTSFSNQEQASNIWQSAFKNVSESDNNLFSAQVDFEFSSAQVLSTFSNGMNLQKWHKDRTQIQLTRSNIGDFFAMNDELTIYLQLNDIWKIILVDITKQENITWIEVFNNSIDLFALNQDKASKLSDSKDAESFLLQLINWTNSNKYNDELADLMRVSDRGNQFNKPLYQSILRYHLNKQHLHFLATTLSWIEVTYHLAAEKNNFSEKEIAVVSEFIERADTWFLSQEGPLIAVNVKLPELIESSIHNLKSFYRDTGGNLDFTQKLSTIFQLIEPRFNFYMATPFRREIHKNLEICLNISEETLPLPEQITLNQFLGCMDDFNQAAVVEAKTRELSGALRKTETTEALDRELKLPAWQRINILYANEANSECLDESMRLVSPFEWMLAAESLLWFKDRWPGYMVSQKDFSKINEIIAEGERLVKGFECMDSTPDEMLNMQYSQIALSWQNVKTQIKKVANEFNQLNLSKGSDIDLLANSENLSNYRVEDAIITACDAQKSCGVHVDLESSRALFGLFPNHLLMADQLQLGKLMLCYDNVGWENRRNASTHLDNDSVANYFGNFSFSIKGYYNEALVFERKLSAKNEQYYLFAENNEEVLATYCPLSIVGSKISTILKRGTYGLVPNRLTFLTASRANESKILTSNWSSGEEWKDQISSSQALVVSEDLHMELSDLSQQAYQEKANQLQDLIYKSLLNRLLEPTEEQALLTESFNAMIRSTRLFNHLLYVIHEDELMSNDRLHSILFGIDKIPDIFDLNEYYKNQLNINLLIDSIDENMKNNQNKWNKFTSNGSHAYLYNILYRLKNL